MREQFIARRFNDRSRKMIEQVNAIIDEYEDRGFKLTVRQLYYQFVARDLLQNSQRSYGRLCSVIKHGRNAGEIDWDMIEDRTRRLQDFATYDGPADRIKSASWSYCEDPWRDQKYRPEVWIEKDALLNTIEGICSDFTVPYLAQRGSVSASVMKQAGDRFANVLDQGQTPLVLLLTDHDPTGIQMHTDAIARLARYARQGIEVRRLALTKQQARQYRAPPNPAKDTDPRYSDYERQHGTKCWELDALSPQVIADLIRTELNTLIDQKWDAARRHEQANRDLIQWAADNWSKVEKLREAA